MDLLYNELNERLAYLKAQPSSEENKYRILECTLTIVRVQQILLSSIKSKKV